MPSQFLDDFCFVYEEVKTSDELKNEFVEAAKTDKITEFLKAHDCDVTDDDLREFIMGKTANNKTTKLDDEELDLVAEGTLNSQLCTIICGRWS